MQRLLMLSFTMAYCFVACGGGNSEYSSQKNAAEYSELGQSITSEGSLTDLKSSVIHFVGKHLIYTYENGWQYEIYVRNDHSLDYRIHSGFVGGRWVTQQEAKIVQLAFNVYKISWDEPTGTVVSLAINLNRRKLHGAAFFPKWVADNPQKTVLYQNDYIDLMLQYRDQGPTYPKFIVDEFADITWVEDCGPDRNDVISCPPSLLPADYGSPGPGRHYCSVPCGTPE